MNTTLADAQRSLAWRDIEPTSLNHVRAMLLIKHGSLSQAAVTMQMPFVRLSMALNGRENIVWIVAAIQRDLELSNDQVLALWPLLREWPKADRRAA